MAEIMTADKLKKDILDDMRVELSDEFDKNFERKAFFTDAWKARKDPKANGSLFPFHWIGLLKTLKAKQIDTIDTLLIAVRPDYQDKGIPSMIFAEQLPYYKQYGVKLLETTSILETNNKNLANFTILPHKQHRRRRAYIKEI